MFIIFNVKVLDICLYVITSYLYKKNYLSETREKTRTASEEILAFTKNNIIRRFDRLWEPHTHQAVKWRTTFQSFALHQLSAECAGWTRKWHGLQQADMFAAAAASVAKSGVYWKLPNGCVYKCQVNLVKGDLSKWVLDKL